MNPETKPLTILEHFSDLLDPRLEPRCDHKLIDIIFIAVCAVICGADGFTDMEEFGIAKATWLRQFLDLPNGIPSHDTFNRVLARLNPKEFQRCFLAWVQAVVQVTDGQVVAIDGKRLRRSHNRRDGRAAIELVSAWAQTNRLTLGQVKVNDASNEITAVPELLRLLCLRGCIVTVDALNCQKEIAAEIRQQGADYVLALKGNHGQLYTDVVQFFAALRDERTVNFQISQHREVDGEHGRIETRRYWQVNVPGHLRGVAEWQDLRSIAMVEARREVNGAVSCERRYYLSSLAVEAQRMAAAIRGHWGIENSCHWILDVVFREDDSRVRVGEAAENLALLRRTALSLLAQEKTLKRGIKTKRLKAALDDGYLLKILTT